MKLTQYDLLSGETAVLVDSHGYLDGNLLTYWEDRERTVRHEVEFGVGFVVMKRFAEITSETRLNRLGRDRSVVKSPYGEFRLETETLMYTSDEDSRMVEYRIIQDKEVVTHQKLVWELRGLRDE